jgi:hypothetical protein
VARFSQRAIVSGLSGHYAELGYHGCGRFGIRHALVRRPEPVRCTLNGVIPKSALFADPREGSALGFAIPRALYVAAAVVAVVELPEYSALKSTPISGQSVP